MTTTNYQEADNLPELDLDRYDMDDEERYGERTTHSDNETGEAYYYDLNGNKYWVEV